jgi:hypothetical protein
MMKLFNQLEQVENATPLARSDDGNISAEGIEPGFETLEPHLNLPDAMAHETGPHETPKLSISLRVSKRS